MPESLWGLREAELGGDLYTLGGKDRADKEVASIHRQSHYREVPRREIFMEQELRFGLDLGQMANFPAFIASKSQMK